MTNILDNRRINRIVRTLADELELAKPLTYLSRVPIGDVYNNSDILAEYSADIYMADIIMNDSRARVVRTGSLTYGEQRQVIPNIKIGEKISQDQMEKFNLLAAGLSDVPSGPLKDEVLRYELSMARRLVQGIRETMNLLCAAAYLDGVTYSRFGVQIAPGFNTPNALKTTLVGADTWEVANLTTFDAIDDILALSLTAATDYGKTYNRADMSTAKFQLIIQSDAFKDDIRTLNGLAATDPVDISIYNIKRAKDLFELISGFEVVLEDKNVVYLDELNAPVSSRVLPNDKTVLSSRDDDGDDFAIDFAMGIPEEAIASRFVPNGPMVDYGQQGIAAYWSINPSYNPPDMTAWAVAKGFPRKKDKYMSAILTTE
jgi:hypothetical protein